MCDEAEEEEEMMIGPFIQKHEKERERKGIERERERELKKFGVWRESSLKGLSSFLLYSSSFFFNPSAPPRGNFVRQGTHR